MDPSRRLLVLLVLLPELVLFGLRGGAVLCLGADGHARFEMPSGSCCDEGAPGAPDPGEDGDCGPCVDLLLPLDVARAPDRAGGPPAAPARTVPRAIAGACAAERVALRRRGHAPPHLARVATVRMRC